MLVQSGFYEREREREREGVGMGRKEKKNKFLKGGNNENESWV